MVSSAIFCLFSQFLSLPTPDFRTIRQWLQKLQSDVHELQYHDRKVLSLNVLDSTKGTIVAHILHDLTDIIGQPLQIISDHGPDLIKGIKLHQQQHPDIISTYDFTHQLETFGQSFFSKIKQAFSNI